MCVGVRVLQAHAARVCKAAPRLQAHGFGFPLQLHTTFHVILTMLLLLKLLLLRRRLHAAPVAVRPQLQHLQTATYKRIGIFARWAVKMHTLNCGAHAAAVLQRKMWGQHNPHGPACLAAEGP